MMDDKEKTMKQKRGETKYGHLIEEGELRDK